MLPLYFFNLLSPHCSYVLPLRSAANLDGWSRLPASCVSIDILAVVELETIWIADEGGDGVTCGFQSEHCSGGKVELLTFGSRLPQELDCRRVRLCRLPGDMMTLFTDGRFRNSHRDRKLVLMLGWCFAGF